MTTVSHSSEVRTGFIGALRQLRDPLLLFVVPDHVRAAEHLPRIPQLVADRLRLPRHALGAGPRAPRRRRRSIRSRRATPSSSATPRSTRRSSSSPSIPLALLPVRSRRGSGSACSASCVFAALWILGVRDWRCHVIARHVAGRGARPVLREPHDPPRRFPSRSPGATAISARSSGSPSASRSRPSCSSGRSSSGCSSRGGSGQRSGRGVRRRASSSALGADRLRGLRDYPALLRAVQDVYAVRSVSLSTVAGALGASGLRRGRRRRRRRPRVPRGRRVARPAARRRPARIRARRGGVHHRVADRLAELRGAALRPDRRHVATARAGLVLRLRRLAHGRGRAEAGRCRRSAAGRRRARAGLGVEPHRARALVCGRRRCWSSVAVALALAMVSLTTRRRSAGRAATP